MTAPEGHETWADVEGRRLPGSVVMEVMEHAFAEAVGRSGCVSEWFQVAGRAVRVDFAGTALVPGLTLALAHLRTAPIDPPALEIRVWDGTTTGVAPRLPKRPSVGLGLQRVVAGPGSVRRFYSELSGALYCFDQQRRVAFCWFERDALFSWDIGAPLRPIFAWWAESLGGQLAHGAVVGTERGAVLLAGKGGAGKSTTALACMEAGLSLAGDDYVLIESQAPQLAHGLYSSAKVTPTELETRFPGLVAFAVSARREADKRVLALQRARPERLARHLPIRAVAAHAVSSSGVTSLRRASAVEVLGALAPSSLLQLPGPDPRGLERLAAVVRGARPFVFRAGRSSEQNAAVVRAMLEEATA